jgi:hypothetical protein
MLRLNMLYQILNSNNEGRIVSELLVFLSFALGCLIYIGSSGVRALPLAAGMNEDATPLCICQSLFCLYVANL